MMKKMLKILVLTVFFWHLLATCLYLAPLNPFAKYYQKPVNWYMRPLFAQHWGLFAPEPATSSLELHVRCAENGTWRSWVNPLSRILSKHHSYRITHHGRLYHLMNGPITDLHNAYINELKKNEEFSFLSLEKLLGFDAIAKVAEHSCRAIAKLNTATTQWQFRIWRKSPPQFSKALNGGSLDPEVTLIYQSQELNLSRSDDV